MTTMEINVPGENGVILTLVVTDQDYMVQLSISQGGSFLGAVKIAPHQLTRLNQAVQATLGLAAPW